MRRKGVQESEEEIRLLRKELHKKAEALHAAKTELKQLKHQVQQQLKELQLTSMCPERVGSMVSQYNRCKVYYHIIVRYFYVQLIDVHG